MAESIIINPSRPSQVVVSGTQKSGTPITINTDLDYTRVRSMIDEALGDINIDTTELAKQGENPEATNSKILEEVQNKLTPLEAVLTELNHGKQEMVDAIKAKGGNSNADKSLSEIANDVRAISNVDKTFNEVEYFMTLYGLSMSPLQLIAKHFDTEYLTYVCYIVDADTKINVQRSAYVMFTADGAIENPEGEYTIQEWENRFGYFIFAYKSSAVTWEDYSAYFIGMYGANTALDNRTLTKFRGIECDASVIDLGNSCFNGRTIEFINFHKSSVTISGTNIFDNSSLRSLTMPQVKKITSGAIWNNSSISLACLDGLEEVGIRALRGGVSKISLNGLRRLSTNGLTNMMNINELCLPSLESADGSVCVDSMQSLERFIAPNATNMNGYSIFGNCPKLIDIECGEISTSTSWNKWEPTSVLSNEEQIPILDKNLREHVAAKIKNLTGGTPQTFTFHQNVRNIMSEETENVFKAKNWNIAPTKSV